MTVKQWINCIKNINSYLPLMQQNARAFSEEDLNAKVILLTFLPLWNKLEQRLSVSKPALKNAD
jgi:hypothetical protein